MLCFSLLDLSIVKNRKSIGKRMKKLAFPLLSLVALHYVLRHAPLATLLLVLPLLVACGGKTQAEQNREVAEREGALLLGKARQALRADDYEQARRFVMALRSDQPLALDARRQAILLLDSIELRAAKDSIHFLEGEDWERINMKVQFYERKLREDVKHYGE